MTKVCFIIFAFCFGTILRTLFICVGQFILKTKIRLEVGRFCFNVLRAFSLNVRKFPRLFDKVCFPNCRSAYLRFLMASSRSSLNNGSPGRFWFVEIIGTVLLSIDIVVFH
jgi:hypothetical protein